MRDDGTTAAPREKLYWACQLGGWGLYLVVTIYQGWTLGEGLSRAITESLFTAMLGISLTHGFRRVVRRRRWVALGQGALALRLIGSAMLLAVVLVAVVGTLEALAYGDPPSPYSLLFAWMRWSLALFTWVALYFGSALLRARHQADLQRLQATKALQAAELRSLKSQLNPHFLFNCLNSVRALIADDPQLAQEAVTRLARALRYTLASGNEELVTVDRELEMVEDYIGLEALRLGDRLKVERQIQASVSQARIPVMLIQTLVENAVKHGIAQLPSGGTLQLSIRQQGGVLLLDVDNPRPTSSNGDGRDGREEDGSGIGLANALERLRLLFGPEAGLSLDLSRDGHATASVRIPLRA